MLCNISTVVGAAILNDFWILNLWFLSKLWDISRCMKNFGTIFKSDYWSKINILSPKSSFLTIKNDKVCTWEHVNEAYIKIFLTITWLLNIIKVRYGELWGARCGYTLKFQKNSIKLIKMSGTPGVWPYSPKRNH